MCPESIPRIWLHPPAVAVGNTFQIGNHLPVSRLCSLGGCLLSFFPLAPVPLSTCFCSFVLLSSVLLSFCLPFPFLFSCSFVLLSSVPFIFFSVLLSFCLPSRFPFFCSFVLLSSVPFSFFCSSVLLSSFPFSFFFCSSVLLSFCLPFPPALYNIIRCSPRRRAFCALDSCQER